MTIYPAVDVNAFVFNGAATIAETLDSVLSQRWSALNVTVIDNASTDDTCSIVRKFAEIDSRVKLKQNPMNIGPVLNCQRAFEEGTSDFILPKTGDDLLSPDFIPEIMEVLLSDSKIAMCHSAGLVFDDSQSVRYTYPKSHSLNAVDDDPLERAREVMAHYTSAPAFWGVYRRRAVACLAPIAYRPGWDHAVLAELALYGQIRAVDQTLFWRRSGGKNVGELARGCSQFTQRGLELDDGLADLFWRIPLIATAYGHIERFALARKSAHERRQLITEVPGIFRARWLHLLRREASDFRSFLPSIFERIASERGVVASWCARQLHEVFTALEAILPEEDFSSERTILHAVATGRMPA